MMRGTFMTAERCAGIGIDAVFSGSAQRRLGFREPALGRSSFASRRVAS